MRLCSYPSPCSDGDTSANVQDGCTHLYDREDDAVAGKEVLRAGASSEAVDGTR